MQLVRGLLLWMSKRSRSNEDAVLIGLPVDGEERIGELLDLLDPHNCALCSKVFPAQRNLDRHMWYHTGPFTCEFNQRGASNGSMRVFYTPSLPAVP